MTHTPRALIAFSLAMGVLIAGVSVNPAPIGAAEGCRYFELSSILVNVRRDPARPGGYLDVLERGDTACVTEERKIDNVTWAFVRDKTSDDGNVSEVGGWANMRYLTPGDRPAASEAAATPAAPEQPTPESPSGTSKPAPKAEIAAEPAAPEKPAESAASQTASAASAGPSSDQLRFDEPVPFGAFPVQGRTLKELAGGEPLFPPIEGLPEELWKKPCATCHKWNQERLCEQGNSYLKAAKYVLRHQHPYGGTYKLALMRWAKSGCQ